MGLDVYVLRLLSAPREEEHAMVCCDVADSKYIFTLQTLDRIHHAAPTQTMH